MSYINNHIYQGLSRLLEQYKSKLKISGLLTSLISRYQLLEDTLNDIDNKVRLQTAVGAILDRIGSNYSVYRNELSDDLYRQKIYTNILINGSKGNVIGIITAIKLLYNPVKVSVAEYNCMVQINIKQPTNLYHIEKVLPTIVAAGVKYSVVYESDKCGTLASLTYGKVDFTVNDQNINEDLIVNTTNNLQVIAPVVNVPKNNFKLGLRLTNTQLYQTSVGTYLVDENEALNVIPNPTSKTLLKGSDLAMRIM